MAEQQVHIDACGNRKRGGFFRKFLMLCGIALMVLVIAAGYMYKQSRTPAKHVQEFRAYIENTTPAQRKALADNLEARVMKDLLRADHRGGGERKVGSAPRQIVAAEASYGQTRNVSMSLNEMQAWMDQKFLDWMANRGKSIPSGVSEINIAVQGDKPVLFFNFTHDGYRQDVSVYFTIELPPQGKGRIMVNHVGPGSLSLPSGVAAKLAQQSGVSADQELFARVREAVDGMEFDSVMEIDGLRNGRIINMTFRKDGCDLSVLIEPPHGKQAAVPTR